MAHTQLAGTIANSTIHNRRDRPLARNHRAAASHKRLVIATPAISSVATGSGSGKGECHGSQTPAAMIASPTPARPMVRAPATGLGAEPARVVAAESVIAAGRAAGNACHIVARASTRNYGVHPVPLTGYALGLGCVHHDQKEACLVGRH
jgi:hypothetical protein